VTIIVRRLGASDAAAAGPLFELAAGFATSFVPERAVFEASLSALLTQDSAWLGIASETVAEPGAGPDTVAGYCLGFDHLAFYANGRVAWVEEIMVREDRRGQGVGRLMMEAFEAWAADRDDRLVGLASRRAAPFYAALGYEDSATFFRKLLTSPNLGKAANVHLP
jgi:GNAT superfamily N-acetyltransferase